MPAGAPKAAKLFAPTLRATTVPRTALLQRLEEHRGVALVIAPPGFGKTTLLAQWEQSDDRPFAWLTLDASDNDPVVLCTYVMLAVRSFEPHIADKSRTARHQRADLDVVIPELLSDLGAFGSEVVLVLEDFHWITDPTCLALLAQFLEGLPPNVTVVLSARSDLQLPVGALRVRFELLEIRAADLAFTPEETGRLLNGAFGLGLGPAAVRSLWERTEGWPAGLYLAYLSMRDSRDPEHVVEQFGGSNRRVGEYLTEILDAQDARTREFLLETSVLERMTGPLCDYVLGTERSAQLLETLERADLLVVALDDRREWYRYHHLFLDLLRDELERRQPRRATELHRRASQWLRVRDPGEAIRHALAAGDVDDAIQLVSESYLRTLEWGGLSTIEHWLGMFDRNDVVSDARLSVVEGWVLSLANRYAEADLAVENALRAGYQAPLPDGARSVEASAALIRASAPRGDVGEMLRAARKAFELEGDSGSMWEVTTHVQLGWALLLSGALHEAQPLLERAAMRAPMTEQWLNAFGARCLLAWTAMWDGRIAEAEEWAVGGVQIAEDVLRQNAASEWGAATLGAVRAAQGRFEEADELLTGSLARLRGASAALLLAGALLAFAPVRRVRGSRADARAVLEEARRLIDACADPGILRDQLETVARSLTPAHRGVPSTSSPLTDRELDVLRLLGDGMSKREIAQSLYVSFNTIHTHTRSIYRKLGAFSRAEAIRVAHERGILPKTIA